MSPKLSTYLNIGVFATYALFTLWFAAMVISIGAPDMLISAFVMFMFFFLLHMNWLKDKGWMALLALSPLFWIAAIGAARLAEPGSWWFKNRYTPGGEKALRATERYSGGGLAKRMLDRMVKPVPDKSTETDPLQISDVI